MKFERVFNFLTALFELQIFDKVLRFILSKLCNCAIDLKLRTSITIGRPIEILVYRSDILIALR
ncbi:hypothetical protein SDC9_210270 [bioreactor metagenome]|uniref:Uncharacterized protein n=1 Tax=bioreactor metagenome TaxID=1076179 RepID=A0A645JFY4_9ZZZZ